MIKFYTAAIITAALSAINLAQAQIEGIWITEKKETGSYALVEIFQCDKQICGKITDIINSTKKSKIGTTIITGMNDNNDGTFSGGQIYAPDDDRWYKSKMTLNGEKLAVEGCVTILIDICRSQTWTRQ